MSSPSSSSSSPLLESSILHTVASEKHDKTKNPSISVRSLPGKNDGVDPNSVYKPPSGYTLLKNSTHAGQYDWETITNDENLELWLIRVPESIKPKYFEDLKVEVPSTTSKTARLGTLHRKHATFGIWSVGDDLSEECIGGEEIKSLSCLLPRRSKKGKLYAAPIARHVVLSAQTVTPTVAEPSSSVMTGPFQRPTREYYPPEVLKHTFMPYGSLGKEQSEPDHLDTDEPVTPRSGKKTKQGKASHSNAVVGVGVDVPSRTPKVKHEKSSSAIMNVDLNEGLEAPPLPILKKEKHGKEMVSPSKADIDKAGKAEDKKTKGKKRKGDEGYVAPKKSKKAKTS